MAWTVGTAATEAAPVLQRRSAPWCWGVALALAAAGAVGWAPGGWAAAAWAGAWLLASGLAGYRSARPPTQGPLFAIRDVAEGPVEVVGRALPPATALLSPLTSTKCSFFDYRIELLDKETGQRRVVDQGTRRTDFRLRDVTGSITVRCGDARILVPPQLDQDLRHYDQTPRPVRERLQRLGLDPFATPGQRPAIFVTETRLDPGDNVLVRGQATRDAEGTLSLGPGPYGLQVERWTGPTFMPVVPSRARREVWLGAAALLAGLAGLLL